MMIRTLTISAATLGLLLTAANPAAAASCRDAHGKFAKCPPAASAPAGVRCKDGKGRFAKCGASGAVPIAKK